MLWGAAVCCFGPCISSCCCSTGHAQRRDAPAVLHACHCYRPRTAGGIKSLMYSANELRLVSLASCPLVQVHKGDVDSLLEQTKEAATKVCMYLVHTAQLHIWCCRPTTTSSTTRACSSTNIELAVRLAYVTTVSACSVYLTHGALGALIFCPVRLHCLATD